MNVFNLGNSLVEFLPDSRVLKKHVSLLPIVKKYRHSGGVFVILLQPSYLEV